MTQFNFFDALNQAQQQQTQRPREPKRKVIRNKQQTTKVLIIHTLINIILIGLVYYFTLPALNWHDPGFWLFIFMVYVLFAIEYIDVKQIDSTNNKVISKIVALPCIILVMIIALNLFYTPLIQASTFANRISVEQVGFEELPDFDIDQTAIIDRDTATLVGDKVMGNITDLVSQFDVSDEYTQISYQDSVYRVTPLMYSGIIKTFKNMNNGIPAYITVNSVTGEANIVQLEQGMKYTPSAIFDKDIMRHLRFNYPTEIFGSPSFEIDDDGNPYYVCTTYTYDGIGAIKRVKGVVLVNAITGECTNYMLGEEPTWVDRIYPESLVTEELDNYGQYQAGFFNSFIGQSGVVSTSEGYNYISKNGDIWLYTGITSVNADASNIGFYLVNLRTHQAQQITVASANEMAAMDTAEGEVMNYGYHATFPTLVKINNRPVYLLSLKDDTGLVKMYAMIDAQNYTQVYVTKAEGNIDTAINNLVSQAGGKVVDSSELTSKSITVTSITPIIMDGNTYYYIIDNQQNLYKAQFSDELAAQLLQLTNGTYVNAILTIDYLPSDGVNVIQNITSITQQ